LEQQIAPDVVHRAITLHVGGETDLALDLLLEGKETSATAVEPLECLRLSESAFIQLPGPKLDALKEQNDQAATAARSLARLAVTRVEEARAAGQSESAEEWVVRIDAMGQELSKDHYNAFLRVIGQAILKSAATARLQTTGAA